MLDTHIHTHNLQQTQHLQAGCELVFHLSTVSVYQPFCYLGIAIYAAGVTIRQAWPQTHTSSPFSHTRTHKPKRLNNPSTYLPRRDEAMASPTFRALLNSSSHWLSNHCILLPACLIIEGGAHLAGLTGRQVITVLWIQLHSRKLGSVLLRPDGGHNTPVLWF